MKLSELKERLNPIEKFTEGLEKMDAKELDGQTLTVDNFIIVESNDKPYAIVHCKEYPKNFHFAGMVETNILLEIRNDDECYAEFINFGVKFKYSSVKNKNNQQYMKVTME